MPYLSLCQVSDTPCLPWLARQEAIIEQAATRQSDEDGDAITWKYEEVLKELQRFFSFRDKNKVIAFLRQHYFLPELL